MKRYSTKVPCLLVWALLFCSLPVVSAPVAALGQGEPVSLNTIERTRYAAIAIVCTESAPDLPLKVREIVGSGFFINNEGYFVTAAHVLDAIDKRVEIGQPCTAAIYATVDGWTSINPTQNLKVFAFTTCIRNSQADIAVCRPIKNPFLYPEVSKGVGFMALAAGPPRADGTPVAFTGFPLGNVRPVTSKGNIASYWPFEQLVLIDKASWPGASGSPLYIADGSVIGIVIETGKGEGSGLAYALSVAVITEFLSKNKIVFHLQKQK